ncbi:right-handed parallel beta-helix repeat-containing protein [Arenicella xantha]|uniref:Parallel beta helix pectate lyase-like protein n=1 Tax=Arenicella xantha TaxID=644221 RepID=A0A395JMY1_9GAMM|nr:right-handed parallel beta-helix repeat-containing protein [Arenicella xantha]RBP52909.1 parallel beta helix pectate lyase-like protein [Arenicella xantha]
MALISKLRKKHLAVVISSLICASADAATILFDNVKDNDALCTFREAIESINNGALEAGCFKFNGDFGDNDKVSTLMLNQNLVIELNSAINITHDVTIALPPLHTVTLDAGNNDRAMTISNSAQVVIDRVTVTGGSVADEGGGILVQGSSGLFLNNCSIHGNFAASNGGGISVTGSSEIRLHNCSIRNNYAGGTGGGLRVLSSEVQLVNSDISGNQAAGLSGGAGLIADATNGQIAYSSVSGNIGGGVKISNDSNFYIINSTLSANSSNPAIHVHAGGQAMLLNNTITGNSTTGLAGGGLTVTGETSEVFATNNIFSGNFAKNGILRSEIGRFAGTVHTAGNLIGTIDTINNDAILGITLSNTDITATSDGDYPTPLTSILDTLAANGGPTKSHALKPSSPAIGAGVKNDCPTKDKRGESRTSCDIGSYAFYDPSFFVVPLSNGKAAIFSL